MDALNNYGSFRLAAHIEYLRKQGQQMETQIITILKTIKNSKKMQVEVNIMSTKQQLME